MLYLVARDREQWAVYMREYTRKNAARINAQRSARRAANPDHYRSVDNAYYAAHSEREAAMKRANLALHRDAARERRRQYQLTHKEHLNAVSRARYQRLPEYYKARASARRCAENTRGSYSQVDIVALYATQAGNCAGCRASIATGYEIDHVMPLSRGGSNDIENIQLLCKPCNRRKSAMHPDDWAARLGKLFV